MSITIHCSFNDRYILWAIICTVKAFSHQAWIFLLKMCTEMYLKKDFKGFYQHMHTTADHSPGGALIASRNIHLTNEILCFNWFPGQNGRKLYILHTVCMYHHKRLPQQKNSQGQYMAWDRPAAGIQRWGCSWYSLANIVGHRKGLATISSISIKLGVQREFLRPPSQIACGSSLLLHRIFHWWETAFHLYVFSNLTAEMHEHIE